MGTQFTIVAYGSSEPQLAVAVSSAFDEVLRLNRRWSDYLQGSELSVVNRRASEGPVQVDRELFGMLEACLQFGKETDGAFDVTVGPLVTAWGFFRGPGRLAEKKQIAEALPRVGWQKLRLDAANRTVSFAVPGMRLDLGGVAKGYALDRAGGILRQADINSALLMAATSSILAIGSPPERDGWTVFIRDPKAAKKSVAQVSLKDASLSTSGNYEKFFRAGGRTYSHIIDPRTGYPAQGLLSTSAIAPTAMQTDALSTAFFVLGKEGARRYLRGHPGISAFFCGGEGCEWLAK
jgi:thiamine biosynthesis lipoprotein